MARLILVVLVFLAFNKTALSQSKPSYTVYAAKFAERGQTPISVLVQDGPDKDSVDMAFMIWLIKGSNGKNILVDAGFLNDMDEAREMGIVNYKRPDSVLLQIGIDAGDISDIILTHPHWDHVDGITLFPKAHVWIQKDDYGYFAGQAWQKDEGNGGFNKRNVMNLVQLNLEGRLTLVDGDNKEVLPGITVFTGSKHTYNSQYVLVNTGTDKVVLASDNIWIYYNLEHLKPPPSYGTLNSKGYVSAMQRMKTLASDQKLIIPGHDNRMFSTFPKVTSDIIKIR